RRYRLVELGRRMSSRVLGKRADGLAANLSLLARQVVQRYATFRADRPEVFEGGRAWHPSRSDGWIADLGGASRLEAPASGRSDWSRHSLPHRRRLRVCARGGRLRAVSRWVSQATGCLYFLSRTRRAGGCNPALAGGGRRGRQQGLRGEGSRARAALLS